LLWAPQAQAKAFTNYAFPPEISFPAPDKLAYDIVIPGQRGPEGSEERRGDGTFTTKKITTGPYPKLQIAYSGTEPGGQALHWTAYLDAKTLKPWGFTRTFADERGTELLDIIFAEGQIRQTLTQINGETINRQLNNVGDYTLLPLLMLAGRGLVFEEGAMFSSTLLDPDRLSFQTPFIQVVGTEIVTVPAGIYDCWKVEFKMGGQVHRAYYAIKNTRIVAQLETGERVYRLRSHAFIAEEPKPKPKPSKPKAKPKPKDPIGPPIPPP
ncbi:MAG TPA: hypothetical protein VEI97_13010, partial [bacterium]|nr:hypothetical protein [bacterium]